MFICSYVLPLLKGLYVHPLKPYTEMFVLPLQNTKRPGEHSEFLDKIKALVMCLHHNTDVEVYDEVKNLRDYLQYRIDEKEYNDKVAAAKGQLRGISKKSHERCVAKI